VNDYDRVSRVIGYLDRNHDTQPPLAKIADSVGLSMFHFHRLFRRWAGVTPKDFLQCLTAEHAKQRLRESASVLDAALAAGLSGPGRLHDLLVHLESATPGDIKNGGAGLEIRWGITQSPFGACAIGWNPRGICHLAFPDTDADDRLAGGIEAAWPGARLVRDNRGARAWSETVFPEARARSRQLRAFVRGTAFQVKVWRALLRIPPGSVSTYGRLAAAVGSPNSARAVGAACGRNPIAFLIPCHRVIRETGIVQGYRWGATRKRAILGWEAGRQVSAPQPAFIRHSVGP
jgi:AraC family transcriptional regulator of adaptative response/methylated-DNA-[protein]-cysteine methyltransferase